MSIATLSRSSATLDDAEVLAQARAMNLAPGGGVGQAQLMAALYRPGISLPELTALIAGEPALALLGRAMARLDLSARAYHRILKMARTIADMADSKPVLQAHVAEAIQFCRIAGL